MSYVDGFFDRKSDSIKIVERSEKGERIFSEYPARYTVYYKDPKGKFRSIYDEPLSRIICKSTQELQKEIRIYGKDNLYEADLNVMQACFAEHYLNKEAPNLHVAFFDIETGWDPVNGYSSPEDALNPIISIAVYLQWLDKLVCLAIPPDNLTMDQALDMVNHIPDTFLFESEAELLDTFLTLIEDSDVLSGWNSTSFDIPYTVNRVVKKLSKNDARRFCLFDQLPKKREYEKYGKPSVTYDLVGRAHLDSLELYQKYTFEERHSYALDAIAVYELGDRKTEYDGTLDQLYRNDFVTFVEYNRQDTALLDKLDKKLKFLDLANTIAHDATVSLNAVMGSVAIVDQSITNEAHRRGFVVPSKKVKHGSKQAAGAYVAHPRTGLHKWIGSFDINSLYPSTIRALNMGPETIVGQLRPTMTDQYIQSRIEAGKSFAGAWEGMFGTLEFDSVMKRDIATMIHIDWENGESDELSGREIYELIYNSKQPWMLSANGTIFTYAKEGIIPGLLADWYAERKRLQATLKRFKQLEKGIEIKHEGT